MTTDGNLIAELTADHRAVEALFDQIQAMPPGDPLRKETADRITIELVRHSAAEELHLYPLVRARLDGGGDIAEREIHDHTEMERALKRLEGLDVPNTEFNRLVSQVIAEVRTHVAAEEKLIFPALAAACTPQELEELGEEIRKARDQAPTRPHPEAPHHPPANRVFAPGVGMIDRARDFLTGRGNHATRREV